MVYLEEKLYTPENYRDLIKDEDGVLHIDETKLDIFSYYKKLIPQWEPKRTVRPYTELSQVHLDIETQGLDPNIHKILLIGLNNERNMRVMINAYDDERAAILKLFEILENKKPDILNVFRGFEFDLPFIIRRCEILGIVHPFKVADKIKVFKTAQKFSKPTSYYPIYLSYSQGWGYPRHQVAIIDSYHQVLAWDFVARVMTEHNLKAAPVQMGLTDRERVTLSYPEMQQCEKRGDWQTFRKYLDYDLTDTKLLGDALIPPLYYQKLFLDWNFQSISTAGNGSKWQSILADQYPEYYLPETDEKRKFKGALTIAFAGFFGKNGVTQDYECTKFDVTSLYPTSMLLWGIHSRKDNEAYLLMILKYMRAKRIQLKAISGDDKEADRMQAMLKVLINSGYGQFGTTGIGFNDYQAAALVTAYGRAVFRHCIKLIRAFGGKILTCFSGDTGVITDKGVFKMKDIENKSVKVINGDGNWSDVVFTNRGKQKLMKITMRRERELKEIFATPDHRWHITKGNYHKFVGVTTTDFLESGMEIKNVLAPKPNRNLDTRAGIVHGIVYGDGYILDDGKKDANGNYKFHTQLCEDKIEDLEYYLKDFLHGRLISSTEDDSRCKSLRLRLESFINLKELPVNMSNEYLYGFVSGLLATDGTINKGTVRITGNEQTIRYLESICPQIGFKVSNVAICAKKGRITQIRGIRCESKQDTWYISLEGCSIDYRKDLLREFHEDKFTDFNEGNRRNSNWKVVSVEKTDRFEDVYCCVEPNTHKFVLNGGVLSSNCDTDGYFVMHKKGEAEKLRQYLQERMPGNELRIKLPDGRYDEQRDNEIFFINLEAELTAKSVYIPLADRKVKLDETLVDENDQGMVRAGLKKNYIIVHTDKTAAKIAKKRKRNKPIVRDKLKFNGKYRKRDLCILEKQFPVLLINLLVNHGELAARSYYRGIKKQILNETLPKKLIQITRKIKKGEKTLVKLGVGEIGDIVTIYRGLDLPTYSQKTGKLLTKKVPTWTIDGQCNWEFYLKIIEEQFKEIMDFWNPQRSQQLEFIEQLELALV